MMSLVKKICERYNIDYQFVKFLFVGGINTAVGYGLFAFFLFLKFHYALAVLFATIVGICFNFKTTGSIVFKNSDNKLTKKTLILLSNSNTETLKPLSILNIKQETT